MHDDVPRKERYLGLPEEWKIIIIYEEMKRASIFEERALWRLRKREEQVTIVAQMFLLKFTDQINFWIDKC